MRRFQFRLEKVLRFQRQLERHAELRRQEAARELTVAETTLQTTQQRLFQAADSMNIAADRISSAYLREVGFANLLQISDSLHEDQEKVRTARDELSVASQSRARAAAESEALIILKERQWKEHRQVTARELQRQMDETAIRQWIENNSSADSGTEGQ